MTGMRETFHRAMYVGSMIEVDVRGVADLATIAAIEMTYSASERPRSRNRINDIRLFLAFRFRA